MKSLNAGGVLFDLPILIINIIPEQETGFITGFIDLCCVFYGEVNVQGRVKAFLPFDLAASEAYAGLMAASRGRGDAIGQADGFIAAIALSRGFAVATRDTAPFVAAGLAVINPWESGG